MVKGLPGHLGLTAYFWGGGGPASQDGVGGAGKHGPGTPAKKRQIRPKWEWARHSPPAALSGHSAPLPHLQSGASRCGWKFGGGLTWPLPPRLPWFCQKLRSGLQDGHHPGWQPDVQVCHSGAGRGAAPLRRGDSAWELFGFPHIWPAGLSLVFWP